MATVPYSLECTREGGFVMDPNEHKRVGYVTAFDGLNLEAGGLKADLTVSVPYNAGEPGYKGITLADGKDPAVPKIAKVIGVIEKFEWNGGVGDPLKLEFYVSQFNATQIKTKQQMALKTTKMKKLAWWIIDYDQEQKKWFEQSYPKSAQEVTGIITGKENPELDVDLNPVVVKDGIDVNVFKITVGIVPAANEQYTLMFANSAQTPIAKAWGLVVGEWAQKAMTE